MNRLKKSFMSALVFAVGTGTLLAQDSSGGGDSGGAVAAIIGGVLGFIIVVGLSLVIIISMWKVFTKAGKPGWASIVPIYNMIVMWQISQQPVWVIILCFIPYVNAIGLLMISLGMAKSFGKGPGFGIGLWLLPIVFYPMLAFGSAECQCAIEEIAPQAPEAEVAVPEEQE